MHTTTETPADTTKPRVRGVFESVFLALLLVGNLLALLIAWWDRSWLAVWIAILLSPAFNGALLVSGLIAIPFLKSRRPQFSLGRHLALTLGVPIGAVAVHLLTIILLMELHKS